MNTKIEGPHEDKREGANDKDKDKDKDKKTCAFWLFASSQHTITKGSASDSADGDRRLWRTVYCRESILSELRVWKLDRSE